MIRVPTDGDTATVEQVAADRGWCASDTAAALIRVGLNHITELPGSILPNGDRDVTVTRIPKDESAVVRTMAAERTWPITRMAAALLSLGLRHQAELPTADPTSPLARDEELPFDMAS